MRIEGIFDSHAHYDDKQFDGDREELVASLADNGVVAVINASCDILTSHRSLMLTHKNKNFWCGVGIHPHEAKEAPENYIDRLEDLADNPKAVAIGEIGLDYHYDFSPRDVQQRVFHEQMELARKLKLPVIIHSREATKDTLDILGDFPDVRGVIHCFSGSPETAKKELGMGYYIGFTGAVTFKNAKKVKTSAAEVPLDRLLVETDCPYMAPAPLRGRRCDSTLLPYTIEAIAEIKGVSPQEIADSSRENTCALFGIALGE